MCALGVGGRVKSTLQSLQQQSLNGHVPNSKGDKNIEAKMNGTVTLRLQNRLAMHA